MTTPGPLGDYLRARRMRLQPQDVGLAVGSGIRRVPGLRREEVAVLAGVSTDYYLRLEQGRDVNPSDQVLDALARALRLDEVATSYLRELARPVPRPAGPVRDEVDDAMRWLIDSWPLTAAVVHSRHVDVLASNTLAQRLDPNFRTGVNSVLALFVDPAERQLHADWAGLAARSVALLRAVAADGAGGDSHSRLGSLVAEGSARSAAFRDLWERQDVARADGGVHDLRHPVVGPLRLRFRRLPLAGTDGQSVFVYFAEPGSPSAAAMRRLAGPGWEQQGQGRAGCEV